MFSEMLKRRCNPKTTGRLLPLLVLCLWSGCGEPPPLPEFTPLEAQHQIQTAVTEVEGAMRAIAREKGPRAWGAEEMATEIAGELNARVPLTVQSVDGTRQKVTYQAGGAAGAWRIRLTPDLGANRIHVDGYGASTNLPIFQKTIQVPLY